MKNVQSGAMRCGLVYKVNHWFWFLIRITEWKSQRVAWNRTFSGIFGTSVANTDHRCRVVWQTILYGNHTAALTARVFKPEGTTLTFKSGIYTTACSCKPHLRVKSSLENELEANFCLFTTWQFSIVDLSGKCPSKCAFINFSNFYKFAWSCKSRKKPNWFLCVNVTLIRIYNFSFPIDTVSILSHLNYTTGKPD